MYKEEKNIIIAGVGKAEKSELCDRLLAKKYFKYVDMNNVMLYFEKYQSQLQMGHQYKSENVSKKMAQFIGTMVRKGERTIIDTYKLLPIDCIENINNKFTHIYFLGYTNISIEQKFNKIRSFEKEDIETSIEIKR